MNKNRIRLVVLFAHASLFADVLRRNLDSDKYEVLTLDDMMHVEREEDHIFHLMSLRGEDIGCDYVLADDGDHLQRPHKNDKYKMPNKQRQYLQKWQPV